MFEGHDPYLVALSVMIAILGGYTGFGLAARIRGTPGVSARLLLAGAAVFLAVGIWTMHFVGVLAAPLPSDAVYLVLPTIISFLICALVVGISLFFVSIGEPTLPRVASSAVLLGLGVASMHYVGIHGLAGHFAIEHDPSRDLAAQPLQAEQRVGAGLGDLDALDREMLAEEIEMRLRLVELLRRQHRREHRHLGAKLHIHERLDHRVGDEFMAVDAAIDHEAGRDDRGVAPRLRENLRMQRDLERARHLENIDLGPRDMACLDLAQECDPAFLDHLAVPGGLHEGNPLRPCEARMHGRVDGFGSLGVGVLDF